ncbi:hypothetical protein B1813_18885 [Saccharomonospora piscinae]|uniref:Uncharacterized protein n=1 Tax=Saccharomonospora piscinae TaxID=687388 RepID=A0A1V8ZYN4_SACPI|nr:hypothetical protein [Saccharomonospora piscinae]OQO89908.1 hypothetical protein B1813_18885 [Saccharomonospora piscinae]
MTLTRHDDVPLGQHIDIDGQHYVISTVAWPDGRPASAVYRATPDGVVTHGAPDLEGTDPDRLIQHLTGGTS